VTLRVSERYGELDQNPCAGVRVPVDANGEKPARILTHEEAVAIVAAAEAEDVRLGRSFAGPVIALAFGSGLRLGELLALRWGPEGLDLDAGVVRVRRSLDRVRDEQGLYAELAPKSRASRRDVPLALEDVQRLRRHLLATGRPAADAFVFSTPEGESLSPVPARRAFRRACWRAGVFTEDATPQLRAASSYVAFQEACRTANVTEPLPRLHDCRHAFASHALAAGLTAHAVAKLLGHSDAGLVLRRYGHALPDELAGAGDALSAWRKARMEQDRNMAASETADLQG
jgi:integrase